MPATINPFMPYAVKWLEPLAMARAVKAEALWILLLSSIKTSYSGRYSFLARRPIEVIESNEAAALAAKLSRDQPRMDNAWFGWLSYESSATPPSKTAPASMPDFPALLMARFQEIWQFDHEQCLLTCWSDAPPDEALLAAARDAPECVVTLPAITEIHSPMSKDAYFSHVEALLKDIHAGALYQANLTRKFCGKWESAPDSFALFERLMRASPAPYSAYIKHGARAVLSSSPERFLMIEADGGICARPIKGSAARFADKEQDAASRAALMQSAKDRAENLMIVDLMRNDLSKACALGSIRVEGLFEVTTHAKVHHMASTIHGRLRPEVNALEAVLACFPPGSMTGAPKRRVMERLRGMEWYARGVYSGALGWFGGDGSCDLSVVIRTLLVHENMFEFQVGGGIVADSTPEGEWREHLLKACGICAALGLDREKLELL